MYGSGVASFVRLKTALLYGAIGAIAAMAAAMLDAASRQEKDLSGANVI